MGLAKTAELVLCNASITSDECSLDTKLSRMERETFDELCQILCGDLTRWEKRLRKPVSVEKRVAVGVWRLSTGNSYRSCGLQFGLGKSTAKVICQEFEEALCRKEELFI